MYPHTQYVRHNAQISILALYAVTLQSLYALTVHCHCTLSVYTVTANLVRSFLGRGWMVISAPLFVVLYPPPPRTATA